MTQSTPATGGRDLSPFIPAPVQRRRGAPRSIRLPMPAPPAEGWMSLGLLLVMGITFGWSVDNARWVLGRDGLTDFLPLAVVLGILWGFIAASAGWSRWQSHILGAVFAALIVPLLVGSSLVEPGNRSIHDWYVSTAS